MSSLYQVIRECVDIMDVVQSYGIELKRQGRQYVGYSPFKTENNPSFYVVPDKRFFKCFSSGHGGDVVKFVALMENISYHEAAIRLAEKYNLQDKINKHSKTSTLESLRSSVSAYLYRRLLENKEHPVYRYLTDRFGENIDAHLKALLVGFLDETIVNELERLYEPQILKRLGLPVHLARKEPLIVLPVRENNVIVTFMFRTINALDKKYFFSTERKKSIISETVYNINSFTGSDVYVVEGIMDVLAMHVAGIKNVVALLGTAFTPQKLKKLLNYDIITLALDSDKAGYKASLKYAYALVSHNKLVYLLLHTPYKDPDEAIKNNLYNKETIRERRQLITTHIRSRTYKSLETQYVYFKWMDTLIKKVSDRNLRSLYWKDFYQNSYKLPEKPNNNKDDNTKIMECVKAFIGNTGGDYLLSVLLAYWYTQDDSVELQRKNLLMQCSLKECTRIEQCVELLTGKVLSRLQVSGETL